MSTVIIVDSACELPEQLANSRSIKTIPLNIVLGEQPIRDELSGAQTLNFIREGRLNPKVVSSSDAASPEQIEKFLKREIIPRYNYAIVQTVSSKRSDQFEHWQQVIRKLGQLRQESGKDNFGLTVIDTGTAFSGQALVALETIRLARARLSRRELIHRVKDFIPFLQAYTAPADLGYLRRRAVQRGDSTVSLLNTLIGKALRISPVLFGMNNDLGLSARMKGHENAIGRIIEHAMEAIHRGLQSPLITISYAGPLDELEEQPKFYQLQQLAKEKGCKLFTSTARLSSAINLGPRNFGMALAPKDPDFVISE
jgi:DegV family protein with EDD domain